jgi:transcriptional activator SPT7
MTSFQPFSLFLHPSTSNIDKGKGKEILSNTPAPPWWPSELLDEEQKLQGAWWGLAGKNEGYASGLPSIPFMPFGEGVRRGRIPNHKKRRRLENGIPHINGLTNGHTSPKTPPKSPEMETIPELIRLEDVVHNTVDRLCESRRLINQTLEFQRIEAEGGMLPLFMDEDDEKVISKVKKAERLRKRTAMADEREARKRRKLGGEVGEEEAVEGMKRVTAGLLAHAGFDGQLL